jgi:hypothetical protein
VRFVGEVCDAPDVEIKKMILSNLRGSAQAWDCSVYRNPTAELTLSELVETFTERFSC